MSDQKTIYLHTFKKKLFQPPTSPIGLPWSMRKGFDTANPVSRFIRLDEIKDLHNLDLYLNINGVQRQFGNTKDLTYNSFELISYVSKYMTLHEGDMILTGTPKGAENIESGDKLEAGLVEDGREIVKMTFNVKKMIESATNGNKNSKTSDEIK